VLCTSRGSIDGRIFARDGPCAHCGDRPTWPVHWTGSGKADSTVYLCARGDRDESLAIDAGDDA
jgi:hypothetical protein